MDAVCQYALRIFDYLCFDLANLHHHDAYPKKEKDAVKEISGKPEGKRGGFSGESGTKGAFISAIKIIVVYFIQFSGRKGTIFHKK